MSSLPRPLLMIRYEKWAEEYLKSLPPEHFMEATPQATQREITLASFALVKLRRPEVHVFNELLVQYPKRGQAKPGQVVPDNMVVLHEGTIKAKGSYAVELQPAGPFLMLEYVSKDSERKDYDENLRLYERELKVPYYLVYHPDEQELLLFQRNGRRYRIVKPNEQDRYPIPELDLEVAIHDGWMRYWFRGELLPLPADLQRDLDETRAKLAKAQKRADDAERRLEEAERQLAELRAQLKRTPD